MKGWKQFIIMIAVLLILSGCADNVSLQKAVTMEPVGFWYGLWHGMIIHISWVISLFSDDVTIYATYNNGGWYNFGFILGLGGLASSSKTVTRRSK